MKSNKFFKFIGSAVLSLSMAISGAICTNFLNKNANSPFGVEAANGYSYVWNFTEIFEENTKDFEDEAGDPTEYYPSYPEDETDAYLNIIGGRNSSGSYDTYYTGGNAIRFFASTTGSEHYLEVHLPDGTNITGVSVNAYYNDPAAKFSTIYLAASPVSDEKIHTWDVPQNRDTAQELSLPGEKVADVPSTFYVGMNVTSKHIRIAGVSVTYSFNVPVNFKADDNGTLDNPSLTAVPSGTLYELQGENHDLLAIGNNLITYTPKPNSGYMFDKWTVNDVKIESNGTITEYSEFVAHFKADSRIKIDFVAGEGGSIDAPSSMLIDPCSYSIYDFEPNVLVLGDGSTRFTATPNEGYAFDKWTINGEAMIDYDYLYASCEIKALFKTVVKCRIGFYSEFGGFSVNPEGIEPVDSGTNYNVMGDTIIVDGREPVRFLPNEGFTFEGWTVDGYAVHDSGSIDHDIVFVAMVSAPHVHSVEPVDMVNPTCTESGHRRYFKCDCGACFVDKNMIVDIPDIDEWCSPTGAGYIAPTGHTMVHMDGVAPTCTKNGSKDYYHCTSCGKRFEDEQGTKEITNFSSWNLGDGCIQHLGHNYSTPTYEWTPDYAKCTAMVKCTRDGCNDVIKETVDTVYFKEYDATETENEKGHFEATFTNEKFAKQSTPLVEIPNTKLFNVEDELVKQNVNRSLVFSFTNKNNKVEFAKDENGDTLMSLNFGISFGADIYSKLMGAGVTELGIAYRLKGSSSYIYAKLDGAFTNEKMGSKFYYEAVEDAVKNNHFWSARLCIDHIDEEHFLTEFEACIYAKDAKSTYFGSTYTTSVCQTAKDYIDILPNNNEVRKSLPALTYLAGMLAA